MPKKFINNSRREATDAIRGFYYQIELTVLRWLELTGEDHLYCECGEDIDHIKVPINEDPESELLEERILEQIKDIEASITLRNRDAIISLARYYEAIVNNPNIKIKFRFTTTTKVGKEHKISFPRKAKAKANGIDIWEDIRNGIIEGEEAEQFVVLFKQIIGESIRPKKLSQDVYTNFKSYIANTDNNVIIKELIHRFEWATGLPDPPKLESQMQDLLIKGAYANNPTDANKLINDLKLYILELLIKEGDKILTIATLNSCIENQSIMQIDRRRLTRIEDFIDHITSEMDDLRNQFHQLAHKVSSVADSRISFQLPIPDAPPIFPEGYAKRNKLVTELQNLLSNKTWLHLIGGSGMGKTYVAKLLAEFLTISPFQWVSLNGESLSEKLSYKLDQHLLRIANTPYISELVQSYYNGLLTRQELTKLCASRIGADNLIVIDEIPDLTQAKYHELTEQLEHLSNVFQSYNIKLITTGQRSLPSSIVNRISNRFIEHSIPPLSQEDIIDLTTALSAPPSFFSHPGHIDLIRNTTQGHPQLVYATILHIRNNGWSITQENLEVILRGEPIVGIKEDTQRKVRNLLRSDRDLRELLYRLSLVGYSFDKSVVMAVAKVPQSLSLAGELFTELVGPWVNKVTSDRFYISPLLKNVGKDTLDLNLQQNIHSAIAAQFMTKGTITQQEASETIYHLSAACDWPNLAFFIFQLSLNIQKQFQAQGFELVEYYFKEHWPKDMPTQLRILFRAAQIRILGFLRKDSKSLINDLDKMIEQVSDQMNDEYNASIVLLAYSVGILHPLVQPSMAAEKTLKILRLFEQLPEDIRKLRNKAAIAAGVWMGSSNIRTHEDILNTISIIGYMTEEERKEAFSNPILYDSPRIFAERCWIMELLDKPVEERNWDKALSVINKLEEIAQLPGTGQFPAFVARSKAIILSQYPGRLQEAMRIIELALYRTDSYTRFLLNYTSGYILLENNQSEESLKWFQRAFTEPVGNPTHLIFLHEAFLYAVEAAGKTTQWQMVCAFVLKALRLKLPIESDLIYQQFQLLGELAWAYWSLGEHKKAWAAISGLVNKLSQNPNFKSHLFREAYGKTMYLLDWVGKFSQTSQPPSNPLIGELMVEPFPGLFARSRPNFADFPLSALVPAVAYRLGQFGEAIGLYGLACCRFSEAIQLARSQNLIDLIKAFGASLIQLPHKAARKEDYRAALCAAISSIKFIGDIGTRFEEGSNTTFLTWHRVVNSWNCIPKEERHNAEYLIYWSTIGPAITNILIKGFDNDTHLHTFADLERAFKDNEKNLADIQYWLNAIEKLRKVFNPGTTLEIFEIERSNMPDEEHTLPFLISLAVPLLPKATLKDSFAAQIYGFNALYQNNILMKLMLENMSIHIFKYWIKIAETKAFMLSNPREFKRSLNQFDKFSISNAAKLLLIVSDTIEVSLDVRLRSNIVAIGECNL